MPDPFCVLIFSSHPACVQQARGVSAPMVGGAAALMLAITMLQRWAEYSAARAEERVLRQLELQRRAEDLASVRSVSVGHAFLHLGFHACCMLPALGHTLLGSQRVVVNVQVRVGHAVSGEDAS